MINNVTKWLDDSAAKYGEKIAYADEKQELSFRETQERSLELARHILQVSGYSRKNPVVIYLEKSVDMLVSFFATAYSGNFYTPIDIHMPKERVEKILALLEPRIIITKTEYNEFLDELGTDVPRICIDEPYEAGDREFKDVYEHREKCIDSDLLYVFFTSGSTGVPKGVTICHRSVIDYIDCIENTFKMDSNDIYGNQAPFYFDNSILDIYTTMKTGAKMYIIPERFFGWPGELMDYIVEKKINTIFWVPSALIIVAKLHTLDSYDLDGKLKKIMFCGEVMPNKQLNEWRRNIPNALYANIYGPTEITDACTYYIVDREFADDEPLPIGKAMHNTDIIVLNEHDEPVAENEIGELCVRGVSLSMGYYNNPEKTAEAFVQNPLNHAYIELIYRTGDLVKYNDRGEILYLSRKDFQIKHMGHRIELGEIETAVSSLPEISLNCCLYDEKRSKIVLFVEGDVQLESINSRISRMIPEYMLPGRLITLESMPFNSNGKIDRKALKETYL